MDNRWKRRSDKKKKNQQRLDRSITRDRIWPICSADITGNYACRLAPHFHPHPQTCFMTHLCRLKDIRMWEDEKRNVLWGLTEVKGGWVHWRDVCEERKIEKAKRKEEECCCFTQREYKGWRWLFFLFLRVLSLVCVCVREREPLCGENLFFLLRIILHELSSDILLKEL